MSTVAHTAVNDDDNDFFAALEAELNLLDETETEPTLQTKAVKTETKSEVPEVSDQNETLEVVFTEEKTQTPDGKSKEKSKAPKFNMRQAGASNALRARLGDKLYEYCALTTEQAAMSDADLQASVDEWLTGTLDKLAVKVREKAVNVILSVAGHASLSCYTKRALAILEKHGEMTCEDIRKDYLSRPYTPGTASAQSSQMNALLPALGIVNKDGKRLILAKDSLLIGLLK